MFLLYLYFFLTWRLLLKRTMHFDRHLPAPNLIEVDMDYNDRHV